VGTIDRMVPGKVDSNGRAATRMRRRSSDGSCRYIQIH
jgi:hypothetical protein